jgi:hypothetical protein
VLALRRGVIVAPSDGALPLPSIADRPSFLRDAGLSVQDGVLLELAPPSRFVQVVLCVGTGVRFKASSVRSASDPHNGSASVLRTKDTPRSLFSYDCAGASAGQFAHGVGVPPLALAVCC